MDNKINKIFEENSKKEELLEEKKLHKTYLPSLLAVILGFLFFIGSLGALYYFEMEEWKLKSNYNKNYSELLSQKEKEDENEVKKIVTNIWKSSNLVYNLSIFHVPPKKIIEEVEKAIYLWKDEIITNENMSFSNYTTVSIWLITQNLTNFATLIKKLKKLYSDTFEIKGLKDFWVTYETDENWLKTGKVFYTTNITLKYLKDPWSNLISKWILEDPDNEEIDGQRTLYENNKVSYEILWKLITNLANNRKEEKKKELYVTATTEDNSIYLWTDIEYLGNNIYYLNNENMFTDLLNLNWVWTKEEYQTLKKLKSKILLITSKNWENYGLCTKILKEDLTELEKEDQTKIHTEILSRGKLKTKITDLCKLL